MAKAHRDRRALRAASGASAAPRRSADCWVFDVDGCLVDSLTGTSLRPGARDRLGAPGAARATGSSSGAPEATSTPGPGRSSSVSIALSVATSPRRIATDDGCYRTEHLLLTGSCVVFVDDRPGGPGPRPRRDGGLALLERRPPRPRARGGRPACRTCADGRDKEDTLPFVGPASSESAFELVDQAPLVHGGGVDGAPGEGEPGRAQAADAAGQADRPAGTGHQARARSRAARSACLPPRRPCR